MSFGTENVINTIIRDIIHICSTKGHNIADVLAAYVVKSVLLNPDNGFNTQVAQTKEDVQKIIRFSVDRLLYKQTPSLDTMKMQVFFDMNYATREQFLEEHNEVLRSQMAPIIQEIVRKHPKSREELRHYYNSIISELITWSGIGSPKDEILFKEATAALQSVFPQPELGSFLGLKQNEKERQLEELGYIVTGILLHNKDNGKGGRTIDDVPKVAKSILPKVSCKVEANLKNAFTEAYQTTAFVEQVNIKEVEENQWNIIPLMWEASVNARQEIAYLQVIQNDLRTSAQKTDELYQCFQKKLKELSRAIEFKVAIPTVVVYPIFIKLTHYWRALQGEMVLLSLLYNIADSLKMYTQGRRDLLKSNLVQDLLLRVKVLTDDERLTSNFVGSSLKSGFMKDVEVRLPTQFNNFKEVRMSYQGFCCWSFIKHNLLLPGNPEIGVAIYQGLHYVFHSKEAATDFCMNPNWYTKEMVKKAKRHVELIELLKLRAQIYPSYKDPYLVSTFIQKCDAEIQTDIHPVESNIDRSYEWNEWQLRRKAIELADLRERKTDSTQTSESHLRRENFTQVYPKKENWSQTMKDQGSNHPKPSHYLSGLQGYQHGRAAVFRYFDLTQNLEDY